MHAGKEAIALISIGFSFILLAAVFFLVKRNADLGLYFLDQAVELTDSATDQVISETFDDITNSKKTIPASAAYSLLAYNESSVDSIVCHVCNPFKEGNVSHSLEESCFKDHVHGDVTIWAKKDPLDKQYVIYIGSKISSIVGISGGDNLSYNELAHGEETMDPIAAKQIIEQNLYRINVVNCEICGTVNVSPQQSCLYKNKHAKLKALTLQADFNDGYYDIMVIE